MPRLSFFRMRHPASVLLAGVALALVSFSDSSDAQSDITRVTREAFAIRKFEEIELPQSSVRAVHVCLEGYLWAGTREGLVQYKSGQQTVWEQTTDGVNGLPSGMINSIFEDDDGNIWVGTARGIAVWGMNDDGFRVVIQSQSTDNKQLNIMDIVPVGDRLVAVSASGDLLHVTMNGASYLDYRPVPGNTIPALDNFNPTAATSRGNELIVSTSDNGIFRIRLEAETYENVNVWLSGSPIIDVEADGDSLTFLDRNVGLGSLRISSGEVVGYSSPLLAESQGYYRALSSDSSRQAWFGSGPNLVRKRGNDVDLVRLPARGDEIRSIARDRAGNTWIGTYYGLFYAIDTEFDALRAGNAGDIGLINGAASVGDELFLAGESLWSGKTDADVFHSTQNISVAGAANPDDLFARAAQESQQSVSAIKSDGQHLVIGYFDDGIDVIDLATKRSTSVTRLEDSDPNFPSFGVSGIVDIAPGRWLMSIYLHGLYEMRVTRDPKAAPGVSIRKIASGQRLIGVYALGEDRHLAIAEDGLFTITEIGEALDMRRMAGTPQGIVFAVEPDGYGGAYIGVESAGVFHLPREAIESGQYRPESIPVIHEHLENRTVWHLLLDDSDVLWATTNSGVYVFDLPRQRLLSHVTYVDGLPSDEFEYGPNASMKLPNGEKLFVSTRGPVIFDRPPLKRDNQITLSWTDITSSGNSILDDLQLSEDGSGAIEIPFSSINEGIVVFEYGYDDHVKALNADYAISFDDGGSWVKGSGPRLVMAGDSNWGLTEVQFGMLDRDGNVISNPLEVAINVLPPWYMFWRIDIRVALPLLLLVLGSVYTVQWRAQRKQQLAIAEAERRRELFEAEMRGRLSEKEILLREIHHRVGNILSNFASNVRIMKRQARTDETKDTLEHLNARIKVQSAVHMLLQRSDTTAINVANMIRQVSAGARDFMDRGRNDLVICEVDDVYMTYSKAQYLGLIVNELLTNSYKHAGIDNEGILARVCLQTTDSGGAILYFRDYGCGISEADINQAMNDDRRGTSGGLSQVVAMARELKGQPEIWSEDGIHFTFTIPERLIHSAERADAT
ncbi:MAG: two-component regulator propeller domain-containing protein [Pseudomonadota bacterium]